MINKADSIKLSLSDAKVRFVVVVPDDTDPEPDALTAAIDCLDVRRGVNAWLYSQEAS